LGKLLDPIADKMLVMFALFMVVESNTLPIIFASVCCAIIVSRELLISAIRQIAAAKGSVIMANKFGKIKTIFQDIALPVLLLLKMKDALISISQTFYDCIYYIGLVTFIIATLLTIISGIVYIVQNKGVFASND
ncbi:MAG: CDP-alcohol phosphatidyltransferase family protein, partial [Clostridia bacterium]